MHKPTQSPNKTTNGAAGGNANQVMAAGISPTNAAARYDAKPRDLSKAKSGMPIKLTNTRPTTKAMLMNHPKAGTKAKAERCSIAVATPRIVAATAEPQTKPARL